MTDRMLRSAEDLDALDFDKGGGLVPVVAQDLRSGAVLMVAWADREALARSLETGEMHFFSRSRRALWRKGETSGNVLEIRSLRADCDGDTVLARVEPRGPACHTGEDTCFGSLEEAPAQAPERRGSVIRSLDATLGERARLRPAGSYTVRLLDDENLRLKKLGEEAAELVAALAKGDEARIPEEAADLVYHLLAALHGAGLSWSDVERALEARVPSGPPRH
ncbi:MAG: bifunctional phosphoribosyl-AMP cyclohydrolase/phosphoribosyl-ATP diphosphatase HisIE [Gemmatimonadota bacterium]